MPPPTFDRVLVATDFSEGADAALARALLLPVEASGTVTVLHVLPALPTPDPDLEQATRDALGDAIARAEALAASTGAPRTAARRLPAVAHGSAFVEIVREARRCDAALVVLGRHGRGRPFRDLFLGSTAERVLRKGDRPILCVAAAPRDAYRHPLVGVDLSDDAARATDLCLALAPGARQIDLLHAFPVTAADEDRAASLTALEALGGKTPLLDDTAARVPEPIRRDLGIFFSRFAAPDRVMRRLYRGGDARTAIVDVAALEGSDLIAVGNRGRGAIAATLLGSVSGEVLRRASCDVLAARTASPRFELP